MELLHKLTEENYRMPRMNDCPSEPIDLYDEVMLKCWAADPNARPSFIDLCGQLESCLHNYDPTRDRAELQYARSKIEKSESYSPLPIPPTACG